MGTRLKERRPLRICPWAAAAMVGTILFSSGCRTADFAPKTIPVPMAERRASSLSDVDATTINPVTAEELYSVYSRNLIIRANPDQRFRDRPLLVTGTFQGVSHGVPGRTYLELEGGDAEGFTYAEPRPDAIRSLIEIPPGTRVRLLCRGDGVAAGSPLLRDCVGR